MSVSLDLLEIHLEDVSKKKKVREESVFVLITAFHKKYYFYISGRPSPPIQADLCYPTPCGANSKCQVVGETPVCSCLPNYIGRAPNCRPECTINSECSRTLACVNQRCVDPCPGSCGSNAICTVNNHQPTCRCIDQYTGDPFSVCSPIPSKT